MEKPLVIIGTGISGYTVAREWRNLNKTQPLVLITQESGGFYSKPLLSNAISQQKSAAQLTMIAADKVAQQLNATLWADTTVTDLVLDSKVLQVANQTLEYEQLVLALGASPVQLDFLRGARRAYAINRLADYTAFAERLPAAKHIAIIGAGLVGCEFANDLAAAGYAVSVITPAKTPLETLLPQDVGMVFQRALSDIGISWYTESAIHEYHETADQVEITLSTGQHVAADLVLSAVGIQPEIQLAKRTGLLTQRGILVDRHLQTSAPNVYAVGDCAEVQSFLLPYITPAMRGARALAKTLTGEVTSVIYPPMPILVKTPACPTVITPPLGIMYPAKLHWEIVHQSGKNVKAVCVDDEEQPFGFILMGDQLSEKRQLLPTLSNWLP